MATVWAHFTGRASSVGFATFAPVEETPRHGWSHVCNFDTLSDLLAWLRTSHPPGSVSRLNLHCHGTPGHLYLDFTVSKANANRLDGLGIYLRRDAKLIFSGCEVARDQSGAGFLASLSLSHRGRKIIGFELVSVMGNRLCDPHWHAGDVQYASGLGTSGRLVASGHMSPPGRAGKNPRVTPWNVHSKWAHRGRIIRYPAFEQARRPGRRCASPRCPGHHLPWQQCHAWDPACEW
jgi:hypothetical protein